MSECCEDLERTEEGFEKLPSHEQGDEAEETYRAVLAEADFDPELSYVLRKKLTDTEIVVPVDVPASHCVETRLTHVPTEGQRELLANLGVQLKSKKFTPVEDSVICENWERFSREYGFEDTAPFMLLGQKFFPMKYSERKHFVQYLGSGLPHRTLYSIYARFRTLYRPHVKGKFTEAENYLIMRHLSKGDDKNAFSTLANLLNRDRLSVYKRYKWLQQEQSGQGRITWNLQKVEMVIKSLLKVTGLKDVNDLYHKHITSMDWRKVEKDCGINAEYVRDIWRNKLSTQLFCPEPIYLQEIRIKLIMRLYMDRVKWWQDISWADIAKDFGVGPMFLWGIFRKLLKKCYPYKDWDYFRTHFRATIKDLKKRHIPLLENDAKCYRLQRLRMGQDGKLFVLEEDNYLV
ncbi:uncharacterized protein LOC110836249 isoform X2 [Zootermopsis nevadensis]|nr:uncharacterized protein LOC110836249 isoform X2 [Zootermopsis nevadensis]